MDSDRVIVLDKGEIAEFDTVEALMADKNSIFYSMAKNAGLTGTNVTDMTIDEAIDEAFRLDEDDEDKKNNNNTKM
jgi:ABC-type multidrug transport system ATPase subunit